MNAAACLLAIAGLQDRTHATRWCSRVHVHAACRGAHVVRVSGNARCLELKSYGCDTVCHSVSTVRLFPVSSMSEADTVTSTPSDATKPKNKMFEVTHANTT